MLKKFKIMIGAALSAVVLLVGNAAKAAVVINAPSSQMNLSSVINSVLDSMLGIAGVIALFYIIFGGFTYLTSSGNAEKVQSATKMMTYAIIGVVIIAVSFALKSFLLNTVLGIDTGTNSLTL